MRFSLPARRIRGWRWGIPVTCALTAVTVAIPTLALAGHEDSNVTDYTGCMNSGGSLSNFAVGTAPRSPCSSTQTEVHISGGDIIKAPLPATAASRAEP